MATSRVCEKCGTPLPPERIPFHSVVGGRTTRHLICIRCAQIYFMSLNISGIVKPGAHPSIEDLLNLGQFDQYVNSKLSCDENPHNNLKKHI